MDKSTILFGDINILLTIDRKTRHKISEDTNNTFNQYDLINIYGTLYQQQQNIYSF